MEALGLTCSGKADAGTGKRELVQACLRQRERGGKLERVCGTQGMGTQQAPRKRADGNDGRYLMPTGC
jgi:hypothetical protein